MILLKHMIGFGITIVGGILFSVTGFTPLYALVFIGIFLFASFQSEEVFCDYVIANSTTEALIRKRSCMDFLPFTIVSYILTLGRTTLKIVWKEEYYKATQNPDGNVVPTKMSRKEFIALRNEQRRFYSTETLSKEFMEQSYTEEEIGFKRKKTRLIIAIVFACLMLTGLLEPGGIYLVLIYEVIFVPMILLWIPEYKDAKILQQAYTNAISSKFLSL